MYPKIDITTEFLIGEYSLKVETYRHSQVTIGQCLDSPYADRVNIILHFGASQYNIKKYTTSYREKRKNVWGKSRRKFFLNFAHSNLAGYCILQKKP